SLRAVVFCSFLWLFCFFIFSSRRRHTRFSRDWSSDVCSSDLLIDRVEAELETQLAALPRADIARQALAQSRLLRVDALEQAFERSEERRVGKECRSGWSPQL